MFGTCELVLSGARQCSDYRDSGWRAVSLCCKLRLVGVTLQLELEPTFWLQKASSGEILQRLRGHAERVLCLAFAAGSEKIVSGSEDGRAMDLGMGNFRNGRACI